MGDVVQFPKKIEAPIQIVDIWLFEGLIAGIAAPEDAGITVRLHDLGVSPALSCRKGSQLLNLSPDGEIMQAFMSETGGTENHE